MLRDAMGIMGDVLEGPGVVRDVHRTADGAVWADGVRVGSLDEASARRFLCLAADGVGRVINADAPTLRATVLGRYRVAGTIPPVTEGCTISIRRPGDTVWPLESYGGPVGDVRALVEARANVLVVGSTGSGKTSLVSTCLGMECVARDRVIIIEDCAELVFPGANVVRMLATEGTGVDALVRIAMRQCPDRIVVGEVTSPAEAREAVLAMNTGHKGTMLTIHGNSGAMGLEKLIAFCGGGEWNYICRSVIDATIFMERRRVVECVRC